MTDSHSRASNLLAELGLDARHGAVAMVERYGRAVAEEMRERCAQEVDACATSERITAQRWTGADHEASDAVSVVHARERASQHRTAASALTETASRIRALPTAGERRGEDERPTDHRAGDVWEQPGDPIRWTVTSVDSRGYVNAESDNGDWLGTPAPLRFPASWKRIRRGDAP